MGKSQQSLFEGQRYTLEESIERTAMAINAYATNHNHWVISFSGGKDSSATLAAVLYLIDAGKIPTPQSLSVLYADTGLELLPLHHTAMTILEEVRKRGYKTQVVRPRLDKRFFVYMLGRGIPPPANWFRWCTGALKIEPMMSALQQQRDALGEKFLSMIGVRLGESAIRDARIAIACGKDAECGQGYYQEATPGSVADVMAPIVHWRVCHVWDFLQGFGPNHGLPTAPIARIYGQGDDQHEATARTGCMQCPMPATDTTLMRVLRLPEWSYLAPITGLRPLYDELRQARNRKRKTGLELDAKGRPVSNQNRLGPLTMEARRYGLRRVLEIQDEVNTAAALGRPTVSLIDNEEKARIEELIEQNTWPQKWTGDEQNGDELYAVYTPNKMMQPVIFGD
jgi:DNA sulfur modification protein DndC